MMIEARICPATTADRLGGRAGRGAGCGVCPCLPERPVIEDPRAMPPAGGRPPENAPTGYCGSAVATFSGQMI